MTQVYVLSAAVAILAAGGIRAHSMQRGRVRFNAFLYFSAGFLYYWMLPLLFAAIVDQVDADWARVAVDFIGGLPDGALTSYAWQCAACYAAFLIGYSAIVSPSPPPMSDLGCAHWRNLRPVLVLAVCVAIALAIALRDDMFRGHLDGLIEGVAEEGVIDALPRGSFVAAVSTLFVIALMWGSQATRGNDRPGAFFLSKSLLMYYALELIVVSMGVRLYAMSGVLSLLAFATVRYGVTVRPALLLGGSGVAILAAGTYGVMRVGGEASALQIVTNVLQEPIFTSLSLFSFLAGGDIPAWRAPSFLLHDFVNLLPSTLFPEKAGWIVKPQDYGFDIRSPLGALHSFVSCVVNFGWMGTIGMFGAAGAGVAALHNRARTSLGAVVYSVTSGWLAFSVFRDPMAISIVKNIVQVSLLTPIALNWIASQLEPRRDPGPVVNTGNCSGSDVAARKRPQCEQALIASRRDG